MSYKIAVTALIATALLAAASAGDALAQDQRDEKKSTPPSLTPDQLSKLPEPKIDENSENAKILLDKIEVTGTLAKPQAIFIIPGSDPQVDGIKIDRSFFQEIFRPVEKDFFPQRGKRKLRATIPW